MTFHLTCVHIIFSSVPVAEWPHFGKTCPLGLPYVLFCILTICNISCSMADVFFFDLFSDV